jgi:hypothetical protein
MHPNNIELEQHTLGTQHHRTKQNLRLYRSEKHNHIHLSKPHTQKHLGENMITLLAAAALGHAPAQRLLDSVTTIEVVLPDNTYQIIGSGFLVETASTSTHYAIVTAGHIAVEEVPLRACFTDKLCISLDKPIKGYIKDDDWSMLKDWAYYEVEKPGKHKGLMISDHPDQLPLGDPVMNVGYPDAVLRMSEGYVASDLDDGALHLELNIMKGSSGSPVVDKHDKLICVVSTFDSFMIYSDLETFYPFFDRTDCTIPDLVPHHTTAWSWIH